jgi:hypothetical protein
MNQPWQISFQEAFTYAQTAHEGQYRKFGEDKGKPYFIHPERVAIAAKDMANKFFEHLKLAYMVASVAIVHDVAEDCAFDVGVDPVNRVAADLKFVEWQRLALQLLTKAPQESYDNFIFRILDAVENYQNINERLGAIAALIIKICDIKDNLNGAVGGITIKYNLALRLLEAAYKENAPLAQ